MKLILELNGTKLILSATQAEALADVLHGCEHIKHEYMGRNNGTSEYMDFIRPASMREVLKLSVMPDVEYDAMVFVTKQQDDTAK